MSVDLFKYSDYRDFLRSWINQLPNNGRGELAKIARHLDINSTLLSQIMSGARDLSNEQALTLAKYLGLTKMNLEYFLLLIQLSRAGTYELKNHLQEKIADLQKNLKKFSNRVKSDKTFSDSEKSVFYSSWIYSAIHLFTSLNKNGTTSEDISQAFQLNRSKVNEIMEFLVQTKLCELQNDKYFMSEKSTFVPHGSSHWLRHHLNWRLKSIEMADLLTDDELMYTAQISVSKKDFEKIRELGIEFIKRIKNIVIPSPPEEIININIDLFNIRIKK